MYKTGTCDASDAREIFHVVQERIHQCPRRMTRRWVHHKAGRLIHHQDVFIFIDHADRNRLGQ